MARWRHVSKLLCPVVDKRWVAGVQAEGPQAPLPGDAEKRRRLFNGGLSKDGLGRWAVEAILRVKRATSGGVWGLMRWRGDAATQGAAWDDSWVRLRDMSTWDDSWVGLRDMSMGLRAEVKRICS